ncbi:MAG: hypothetical protein ACE5FI_19630 [Anaerolineales bacterium]
MAIGLSDVLLHWNHEHGLLTPTVGGQPTFTRAGNAFAKVPEPFNVELLTDTPRFEPNGLRLELSQQNELTSPFNLQDSGNWSNVVSRLTLSNAISMFDGHTATKATNAGNSNARLEQTFGTLTASDESAAVLIENVDATITEFWIYDGTAPGPVMKVRYTWATGAVTEVNNSQGTPTGYGAIDDADVGPNGGKVVLLWGIGTPDNSGNSRRLGEHKTNKPPFLPIVKVS